MTEAPQNLQSTACQTLRDRIVAEARTLFQEHGYSKVSATEIAQALGISKKTLYKEFETKEDILKAVVLPKLEASAKELDNILSDPKLTYLERLRAMMTLIGMQYQRVSHVLVRDIYLHAPGVSEEILHYRERRIEKFAELLKQGVREGVFRAEIDPHVVLALYQAAVDGLMNPKTLVELPCTPRETFQNILTIMLEGILREELRQEFKNHSESHA
jgi:AcrR family transcriptional regulator